ncbi:MAG TPA: chromosome segregation protein SMC [Bryobacteraceae bacterium]|nr:chromosome segregation protein SMC [Bryobacteraceae bacterium]
MLKLKRVEIQGFKSFFDRTEMKFSGSGIAAIVGPNGCGKSNLSDAMSWVLGEQSAKSLRGSRMEDVIFAGTRDRKPLGLASVTMTLVDPVADAHHPHNPHEPHEQNGHTNGNGHSNGGANGHHKPSEVTITRRLFRSGESEYLIDGKIARLRDIQDLFIGTGLGPESYAIIEQGRIGQILSNKPQDRRAIIEEAAGIGKFKTKKRLAEAKLEGAKQNLSRVFDILEEVGRQVNSLKRQASKARRYEELKVEMTAHLRASLAARFRMLERDAAKTALDLNLANAEFQSLSNQVSESERAHTELQEACYRNDAELAEARRRLAGLQLDQERTRGRLDSQAQQIGTIEQRLAAGETESQELEKRHEQLRGELEAHLASVVELEAQIQSARERLAAKAAEREQLQQSLQERARTLETGRQNVLRLLGESSALKNQLVKIGEYLAGVDRDSARSQRDEQIAAGDLERLTSVKAQLSQRMSAGQMELESTGDKRRRVEEELNLRKSQAAEARKLLDQLRTDASRFKARKDSLEEILSHRAYTAESVKRLFTAIERGEAEEFRAAGVLADFVEVEPAYEKATEEFLHEELEYVVVENWNEAERGIDLMRTDLDGRATFLVHPESGEEARAIQAISEDEGVIGRLSDHLRFNNGFASAPRDLLPRLAHCFLARDRAAAQRLSIQHPDCFFLLADGVSYHGHAVSGGKKTGSGPLALKRELRELTGEVLVKQRAVEGTATALEQLESEIAGFSEDLESLRALQQSQEKEALALDHEHRQLAEEFARAQSRLSVARLELERLRQEGARAREQQERDQQSLDEREAARLVEEQVLEQSRADFEELQSQAHKLSEEHGQLRADLAALEERQRSERATQARHEAAIASAVARRGELAAEMERLGVERARLLADNIELDARAGELIDLIAGAETSVADLASKETTQRADLAALDEALKQLRITMQAAQEHRSQIELELVRKQSELKFLDENSRKELGIAAEELAAGIETVLDEAGLEEAEQKYQEVKAKIEALGPVNPQALEEFQEAQQRYDFLNAQRQDLLDSIRDTEKAIHEIDVESRRRFSEAFEAVNGFFREMFKTLFGGGIGEMRLTDESNMAESGIDIVASPPGKRLQSVLLLSGGEKSLTAMALLMAIFRYTPSPFCILDEVDAPLDEPNIERLTRLIKEMSSQTQFIVITHAKRTMEAAQALYGVTMQEPGVSKLVSVRFDQGSEAPAPAGSSAAPKAQLAMQGAAH